MTKTSTWLRRLTLLCGTWALLAVPASANTIVPGFLGSVGNTWTYAASVNFSQLTAGDYFTINDFGAAGLVSAPADWAFSQANVGPNSLPTVDTGILNVTFTYTGPTVDIVGAVYSPF